MAAGFSALRRREEFALSGEGMFFEELLFGVPKSNQKGRIRRISPSFGKSPCDFPCGQIRRGNACQKVGRNIASQGTAEYGGRNFACVPHSCRATPSFCGNLQVCAKWCKPLRFCCKSTQCALLAPHRQHFHRHPRQYQVFLCNLLLSSAAFPSALLHESRSPVRVARSCNFQPMDKALSGTFVAGQKYLSEGRPARQGETWKK